MVLFTLIFYKKKSVYMQSSSTVNRSESCKYNLVELKPQ